MTEEVKEILDFYVAKQRDKLARQISQLKDAECRAGVERIKKELEEMLGIPSKTTSPFQLSVVLYSEMWQDFWKGEGVK